MRFNLISLLVLGAFVCLTSCKSSKSSLYEPSEGTEWRAVSMYGELINSTEHTQSPSVIFIDDTSIKGSTGCNLYSGKYTEGEFGAKITLGPMTKMGCPDRTEEIFIKALQETNRVEITHKTVVFYNYDTELIRFEVIR